MRQNFGNLPPIGLLALPAMGLMIVALRAMLVSDAAASYGVPGWQWVFSIVAHDALPLALVGMLAAAAFVAPRRLSPIFALAGVLLIVLMLVDVVVFQQLTHRLLYSDLVKFRKEVGALGSLIRVNAAHLAGMAYLIAGIAATAVVLTSLIPQPRKRPVLATTLMCLALGAFTLFLFRNVVGLRTIHAEYVLNVFEVNANNTVDQPYSPAFQTRLESRAAEPLICEEGRSEPVDIVVVVVESLSAYQSALLGGPLDLTPRLDELARSGAWFTGMLANGFTTDHGLIALLTGRDPIPAIGRYGSLDAYEGFEAAEGSLPQRLSRLGYATTFLANSDLSFLGKGEWLQGLGFDRIEGHDHSFYTGAPRGHFQAAPDGWLFDRALQWLDARPRDTPQLLVLATTSTHPPFTNPVTGERSEPSSFGYLDGETAAFAQSLRDSGFFDNGVLLITSDHRSMTPLRPGELERFGEFAPARIPLIVISEKVMPVGPVSGTFQQIDLPASLDALASDRACRPAHTGLLFAKPPRPAPYAVHSRGDLRNRLEIFIAGDSFGYRLAGDDSNWTETSPTEPLADNIADRIHRERIARGLGTDPSGLLDYYIQQRVPPTAAGNPH